MGEAVPVRLGVVGLGAASAAVLPVAGRHPDVRVTAGADPDPAARERFAARGGRAYPDLGTLLDSADVDAVYVASPTPLHREHVLAALAAGRHVVVEKPMAPSLAAAREMAAAAAAAGRVLLVGHSQSFEAPVRAIRAIVDSGVLGPLRAVNCWYYTDWMYRPRHPDELDAAKGGGVPLRQGAHHADIVRFVGGGLLRSVRAQVGRWDPARRADGAYSAYLEFADGTPVTMFYSGYDHFPSTELTFGVGESGQRFAPGYAVARHRLAGLDAAAEAELKRAGAGGTSRQSDMLRSGTEMPFFGLVIASCAGGDIRVSPDGLLVYGDAARVEIPLGGLPVGRDELFTELARAVRGETPPTHDGRWGVANLEVCEAMVASAGQRREVQLRHQVPLPAQPELPDVVAAAAAARG